MTAKELISRFTDRYHFVISVHERHHSDQYDYDQTYFTVGDYEAIENSALENAEHLVPVYDIDEVPEEITEMEVAEFGTYEDTVLMILISI